MSYELFVVEEENWKAKRGKKTRLTYLRSMASTTTTTTTTTTIIINTASALVRALLATLLTTTAPAVPHVHRWAVHVPAPTLKGTDYSYHHLSHTHTRTHTYIYERRMHVTSSRTASQTPMTTNTLARHGHVYVFGDRDDARTGREDVHT